MKRNKPFTPYEFQIKTLKIEKAALTAERDRYKAERDELIERLQGVIGLINEYFPESNPEVGILMIKRTLEINGLLKGAENVKVDCK